MGKMSMTNTTVSGWEAALRGMRNPLKSWNHSDSIFGEYVDSVPKLGENDKILMKRLCKSAFDCDAKFLRMITVWSDWSMPRYFWSEADTYTFMVKNSESTRHTLLTKDGEFTLRMFEHDDDDETIRTLETIINQLNALRKQYQKIKESKLIKDKSYALNKILRRAKMILPESYIQKRTICTNYQELRNMYRQRMNHRLPEWNNVFVEWIESLPYSWLITD